MKRTLFTAIATLALLALSAFAQTPPKKSAESVRKSDAAEDRPQIIRQLHKDYEDARSQLEQQNPGARTRATQRKIIEGLDKLLDQSNQQNPPTT